MAISLPCLLNSQHSYFIIPLFYHFIYVNPTPGPYTTTGITMRALTSKEKLTSRAIITTTATPKEQRPKRLAKSPRTVMSTLS